MIHLTGVNKTFLLPHERKHTLRQRAISLFQKKSYELFYAVKDLNLEIPQGEFLGIIGRNGSGKSTLLKLIARVLLPASGTICVDGNIAPFLELGVGFQGDLSARDNIFFYGAMLGLNRKEVLDRYDTILDFAELRHFEDTKLKNLSSGMQVRLGFAITVSVDTSVLLVDEVLAVGDIDFQKKCYDCFEDFKRRGKTIVFVSHDLAAIEKFSDRVAYMKDGRLEMIGSPTSVLNNYTQSAP
jgi:lipopolysaccharide transport system ATP-binding protein